jgi:uncharacterized membrane protein
MSLVVCPDCQTNISDLAPACPKCGRPGGKGAQRTTSTVGSGVKIGFGMFVVLPILLFFAGCFAVVLIFGSAVSRYDQMKQDARQRIEATK